MTNPTSIQSPDNALSLKISPESLCRRLAYFNGNLDDLLIDLQATAEDLAATLIDPALHQNIQLRLDLAKVQCQFLAATHLPRAALKLTTLLDADKPEVSRRAAMAIMGMAGISTKPPEPPKLTPPPPPEPEDITSEINYCDRALQNATDLFAHHGIDLAKLIRKNPADFPTYLNTFLHEIERTEDIDEEFDQQLDPSDRAEQTADSLLENHDIDLGKLPSAKLPAFAHYIKAYTPPPATPIPPSPHINPALLQRLHEFRQSRQILRNTQTRTAAIPLPDPPTPTANPHSTLSIQPSSLPPHTNQTPITTSKNPRTNPPTQRPSLALETSPPKSP